MDDERMITIMVTIMAVALIVMTGVTIVNAGQKESEPESAVDAAVRNIDKYGGTIYLTDGSTIRVFSDADVSGDEYGICIDRELYIPMTSIRHFVVSGYEEYNEENVVCHWR